MKGLLVLIAALSVLVQSNKAFEHGLNETQATTIRTSSNNTNCKEDNNEEYVLCSNCVDTCQKIVSKRPEQEFAGCACKHDFVLDEETNRCISSSEASEKCHPAPLQEDSLNTSSYPKHIGDASSMPGGDVNKSSTEAQSVTHDPNHSPFTLNATNTTDNTTQNGPTTTQKDNSTIKEETTTAFTEMTTGTKPDRHHTSPMANVTEVGNSTISSVVSTVANGTTLNDTNVTVTATTSNGSSPSTTDIKIETTKLNSNTSEHTSQANTDPTTITSHENTGTTKSTTYDITETESIPTSTDADLEQDVSEGNDDEEELSDSRRKRSLNKKRNYRHFRIPDADATGFKFQVNDDVIIVPAYRRT